MTGFLIRGLFRDRSRSIFPFLTVVIGVALTVFMDAYLRGAKDSIIDTTARFVCGHLMVTTRARAKEGITGSNELALVEAGNLIQRLKSEFGELDWCERIRFSGLVDVPDSLGTTRAQAPITGMALDLSSNSSELKLLRLERAIRMGRLPQHRREIIISEELTRQLEVKPGDRLTLISATMDGGMAIADFILAGTVRFGVTAMDRGLIIARIEDAQEVLGMVDVASEIIGIFKNGGYDDQRAIKLADRFNAAQPEGEFSPVMQPLREASGLSGMIDMLSSVTGLILLIFVLAMVVVLWNAGLMNSLRRYGEIGIRLALGEPKSGVYLSLLAEAFFIGLAGSLVGTIIGLGAGFYLQEVGINISRMMKNTALVIDDVIRARIAPGSFFIGFLPGLFATFLGNAISGMAVFRRQTAQLAKEFSE